MITIYRDEHNKLQQSIVEENYRYLHLGQELYINNKKFVITNIEKTELKRIVHLISLESKLSTRLDFNEKKGMYDDIENLVRKNK